MLLKSDEETTLLLYVLYLMHDDPDSNHKHPFNCSMQFIDEATPTSVYVWQISFDVQLQIQSVMWRFQKQKWMSIDIYIFF